MFTTVKLSIYLFSAKQAMYFWGNCAGDRKIDKNFENNFFGIFCQSGRFMSTRGHVLALPKGSKKAAF